VKKVELPDTADMGVAIEGSAKWWPNSDKQAKLPEFDKFNRQTYYIEVFNRGKTPFEYTAEPSKPWLRVEPAKGEIEIQQRLNVSVDWDKVPACTQNASIEITGPDANSVTVQAVVKNPESPKRDEIEGFVESNGYVSIEAAHYTNAVYAEPVEWLTIPDAGRTLSGVTPMPVTAKPQTPGGNSPRLEYKVNFFNTGDIKVKVYMSPVQNFNKTQGLRYAISFDDEQPKTVNIHEGDDVPDWKYPQWWNQMVGDSIKIAESTHKIEKPGEHVLKFWMVDPGIVLQKIVIDTGGIEPSYLGPPESYHRSSDSSKKVFEKGCCAVSGSEK
jgi:hypothetical protein